MEFKLSPLILFIILLLALALSAMWKTYLEKEGFITYNKNSALFTTKTVGIYSTENPITKIYDDIYYDPRNGNIVVIYTKDNLQSITGSGTDDEEGKTIKNIQIIPRKYDSSPSGQIISYTNETYDKVEDGQSKAEAIKQVLAESRKSTIDPIDVAWSFKSGQNQVNYITWGANTYIYVMDISNLAIAGNSSSFAGNSYSGTVKHCSAVFYTGSINPLVSIDFSKDDENGDIADDIYVDSRGYPQQYADGYDDKTMIETFYHPSRTVYQITGKIKYDVANGNLLVIKTQIVEPKKTVAVYYRSGTGKREDDNSPDVELTGVADANSSSKDWITQPFNKSVNKPFFVQDTDNKNTIMYWPVGENTIIVVFENRNANGYMPIKKVVRFTSIGVYTSSSSSGDKKKDDEKNDDKKKDDTKAGDSSGNYGDFWKWWSYFNSNAVGGISNDYMLKTQIVPPVCPSCPACSGGACTNCGGSGGSGSMAADGSSLAVKGPSSAVASLGQSAGATISNTANAVGSTIQGTAAVGGITAVTGGAIAADLASRTLDTAGNIVGKTVDTAGNIVGKTVDVAGNVIDRTFDTAGNVINTTGGLVRDAGTGVSNLLSVDPRRVGYEQSYNGPRPGSNYTGIYTPLNQNQKQKGQPLDPYSYNGALQSKGGNFRPVTADFSAFGL
jgi:hypothetical protein